MSENAKWKWHGVEWSLSPCFFLCVCASTNWVHPVLNLKSISAGQNLKLPLKLKSHHLGYCGSITTQKLLSDLKNKTSGDMVPLKFLSGSFSHDPREPTVPFACWILRTFIYLWQWVTNSTHTMHISWLEYTYNNKQKRSLDSVHELYWTQECRRYHFPQTRTDTAAWTHFSWSHHKAALNFKYTEA